MTMESVRRERKKPWLIARNAEDELESKLGFELFSEGERRLGWLLTFAPSSWEDHDTGKAHSCLDLYFVAQDGSTFKSKYKFRPYFYAATKEKMEMEVDTYLKRRYEDQIANIEIIVKEDLSLKNHLSGLQKPYLKVSFDTVPQLTRVRNDLMHVVERNQVELDAAEAYEPTVALKSKQRHQDFIDCIIDIREYDVPYHVRVAIDNDIRCGQWYNVSVSSDSVVLEKRTDLLQRAEVRVCAFDIETSKLPLKFPDAEYDLIMMISYMVDGQGYLIINRECVSEDIEDLEYTPKPEYEGYFKVTNVKSEVELLLLWFSHVREVKPGVYVTYNGDYFDWPFLEKRAQHHGLKMIDEIGLQCDNIQGVCHARFACHVDCFAWVKRDSYLPQGSHGLKAVTKAKLGYDPLEVNPEDMVRFAKEKPQMMASYSVSDAVATYYLYMTYVHPFIFSLATIIPMPPDEVLRKGSGTLCEMLLMVEAFKANVICPNKHQSDPEKFYNNQLLESETYIGGHVECLESGVFRSDLPTNFKLESSAFEELIANLDRDLKYAITVEGKMNLDSVTNYDEVKDVIGNKLKRLGDEPIRQECPLIYHLDVAAMYPNIILTNRLQPPSIVSDDICTACDFNRPDKTCLRRLEWVWRGETYTAKKSDYFHIKRQIESELVNGDCQSYKLFTDLPKVEQQTKLKERLKKYCQKAYKRVLDKPVTEVREAGICMRENPFYVDTVRSFRDRRYEYKGLNKAWKGKLSDAKANGNSIEIQEAQDMVVLYDSLQLAHKCILNSFYGYVMRKGARWYSMEMAGVVTYTGAKIIQNARLLIEKIGKPLELDTDGIWCALPGSFPENFTFRTKYPGKKFTISYPCVMLNVDVAINNTNDQYQTLKDPVRKTYTTHSECSIEFEVDGPYKAMILPASKEEGILIKKRYAVFNDDGTLAELKGFEIKRRGELKLIKVFQAELFGKFLHGSSLEECYSAVASVADRWLDLLDNQGMDIADSELLDFISESSTMSKSLVDYGERKSCAVTTARRLADFLGDTMVKDKGLRCQYIVACEPKGTPVSERAIPVAIFETDPEIMKFYVRKWCKISSAVGIRSIIDWSYYKQRLSSAIQKIITIPAAMQKIPNPVPRVVHPDWLHKKVREKEDKLRQRKLVDLFSSSNRLHTIGVDALTSSHVRHNDVQDVEDIVKKTKTFTAGPTAIIRSYETSNRLCCGGTNENLELPLQEYDHGVEKFVVVEHVDKNINYQEWLEVRKRKWKIEREQRKRQRLSPSKIIGRSNEVANAGNGTVNHKQRQGRIGVHTYYQRQEVALRKYHWQIVQIVLTTNPDQFFSWVVVDGVMLKVPITVPEKFYINSKAPIRGEFPGKRVRKILPHGRPSYNLVEVNTEDGKFRADGRKLAAHLADPEVEGIYETKVPPEFRAILQIGCVCKVDSSARKRNIHDGWSLNELQMKTTTECRYLDQAILYFYLYHSISEGRAIFAAYFSAVSTIHVVVVNPFQNKELSPNIVEKQFREACQTLAVHSPLERNNANCKVHYVGSLQDGEKQLQRVINEERHSQHGPTIAVVECPDVSLLKSGVQVLDDFPCLNMPANARDCHYQALGWQVVAAKIAMQRCAGSSQWLSRRISLSRYAHVPLGNFEIDPVIYTADVLFSRALQDQQHILWISDDGIPDVGGNHEEDTCFIDEVRQLIVTYPGAYRKINVEIKIHHLAVNALIKSNQINEIEGGALFGFDLDMNYGSNNPHEQSEYDDCASCLPAFRVLKQLMQRCIADVGTSGNMFADTMLQHLYRWLCSPRSKLHDPALVRMLHKVMQKLFALLLAEFRKLGAMIIFANFSRIIIDTGKSDLSTARSYCDGLLKTLKTRDLFEWIEFEALNLWHSLLFLDQYNYGGIQASRAMTESNDDDSQVEIISSWNIVDKWPEEIQERFILTVSEFMYNPWKHMQERNAVKTSADDGDICTPSITAAVAEKMETHMTEYIKEQVSSYFMDKLLKVVRDILRHMKDPAMEFIKHVCIVMALDQNVHHDVMVMRKNLLKFARVREHELEAYDFHAYSSFVLPNVICSYCNDCRDVDLRQDSSLLSQEWCCAVPHCQQPYNREAMENALLQVVRQRERLYHLQDLVCKKCGLVKAAHLAEQCTCGGLYDCKENASVFRMKMEVFLDIARKQNFQLLEECTAWILQAH